MLKISIKIPHSFHTTLSAQFNKYTAKPFVRDSIQTDNRDRQAQTWIGSKTTKYRQTEDSEREVENSNLDFLLVKLLPDEVFHSHS